MNRSKALSVDEFLHALVQMAVMKYGRPAHVHACICTCACARADGGREEAHDAFWRLTSADLLL